MHSYPSGEFAKLTKIEVRFLDECDFDISKERSIDSGDESFQILSSSLKIKAGKSRENNKFPGWWQWGKVIAGRREMK